MESIELIKIENAMNFSNLLEIENRVNFQNLLTFLVRFKEIYDKEKIDLPYHINLIDELHADENAHSRIFAKLLRYEVNGKYPFLEKFLNDVCRFNLSVEKPRIKKVDSCGRIDIPIFDMKYVVVIENKVTDKAPDQNIAQGGQLARYIETIKENYNRNIDDIYVIYTPKYTREPSDDCWKNKDYFSYKESFKCRFRSVSYRDRIYPWLKNIILPTIDSKDKYLSSAVEQYIDHLEGIFSLRTIDKNMNMKLQEFIKKELELHDDRPDEAMEILSEKEKELNHAIIQIQQLKSKYQKHLVLNYFKQWEMMLGDEFPTLEIVGDKFIRNNNIINVGVKFSIKNQDFVAIIECNDCSKPNIYLGIGRHFVGNKKHEVSESLKVILENCKLTKPEDFWYGWKDSSLENAYNSLKNLIEEIGASQD